MSLRLKTIVGVGLIEAILLAILVTTVLSYMKSSNKAALESYAETTSTLFATATKDAILSLDLATLYTFTEEIIKNDGVMYVKIFDGQNNLLASDGDQALLDKNFSIDNSYDSINDTLYNTEKTITVDNIEYGRIELGISTEKVEADFKEAQNFAAIIAISEMLLVALFSYVLGSYLTRKLKVLKKSAKSVAAGKLDRLITVKSKDEVGELANSFNKMILSLRKSNKQSKDYLEELDSLNKSLESRVERRTLALAKQKDELEKTCEQLQLTQSQLIQSEKMASIGQLAAGVAHEINNPVAFVKSNLSSLKDYVITYKNLIEKQDTVINLSEKKGNDDYEQAIEAINIVKKEEDIEFIHDDIEGLIDESIDGASRVEEIVSGLKSYVRASDQSFEKYNINDCIATATRLLNNEIKHHCTLETQLNDMPLIEINEGKITQVLTNLITNAIHATEKDGKISIKTNIKDDKNITLAIKDNGHGISKENLSKLFDPFFTTKEVGKGTGLGLSISQGIIEDHKGSIAVDSEPGKGTCFTITLPIS